MSTEDETHDLLFGVRRSIRYHNRRRNFYDRFNSFVNAVSLIMGSATVYGTLKAQAQDIAVIAASVVTILSAINLVVGSARQARIHNDLSKRFIGLEKKIVSGTINNTPIKLAEWTEERLDIEVEEPPVLHVLNCICHNELARAMGYDQKYYVKIAWYQSWFAHILDINDHLIK
ncbi:MAG: hypothetical protein NTV43_10670 [Methylococcales bacterium]|nr:hypothetical protein [Methylococcales bacterium]